MVTENTTEIFYENTIYMVKCQKAGTYFECRTGSGYLVPIKKEDGTVHDVSSQPDGYNNCDWIEEGWTWECYDEGAIKIYVGTVFGLLTTLLILTN